MKNKIYRTYAEINTENIAHNGNIAKKIFCGKKILSVLKADAYGHGIDGVVKAYDTFSDYYAVATVEEGIGIRRQSEKPILLFGPVPEGQILLAAENDLTFTVGSTEYAQKLSSILKTNNMSALCHLKIDTGLNRSGIRYRENINPIKDIEKIYSLDNLSFTGIYTHFACGEGKKEWEQNFTKTQFDRFMSALNEMKNAGLSVGIRHCTSTGGSLVHPEYQLDMVRLGMLPLGMSYSDESTASLGLKIAMTWKSFIAQIEDVSPGEAISYGCTFHAEKPMKIAMVTCGYADGYRRTYSNKSKVIVKGNKVPVLGRIAMDYMLIDVTNLPDVKVGDNVILLGSDGKLTVSAQELSCLGESVSGEVTCAISKRVPRIYNK